MPGLFAFGHDVVAPRLRPGALPRLSLLILADAIQFHLHDQLLLGEKLLGKLRLQRSGLELLRDSLAAPCLTKAALRIGSCLRETGLCPRTPLTTPLPSPLALRLRLA